MALKKAIELDNGVTVNYHRIVSINKVTNQANIIEVASYTSEEKRQEEQQYYENHNTDTINVFINTIFHNKEYDEQETIKQAYEKLKTTDMFLNAEDV